MKHDQIATGGIDIRRLPARPGPGRVALQQDRSAARCHIDPALVGKRTIGTGSAADDDLVVALGWIRLAAVVPRDEKIVKAIFVNQRGTLDGIVGTSRSAL